MIRRVDYFVRFFILWVGISVGPVAMGIALGGTTVAVGIFGLIGLFLVIIAMLSEMRLWRHHQIDLDYSSGHRALFEAMRRVSGKAPRIVVVHDPRNGIEITRSLGGRGLVCVSQGLVSRIREECLERFILEAVQRTGAPGIVFESLCRTLAGSSEGKRSYSPVVGLWRLIQYPWRVFLAWLTRDYRLHRIAFPSAPYL